MRSPAHPAGSAEVYKVVGLGDPCTTLNSGLLSLDTDWGELSRATCANY